MTYRGAAYSSSSSIIYYCAGPLNKEVQLWIIGQTEHKKVYRKKQYSNKEEAKLNSKTVGGGKEEKDINSKYST
jgi:hypothetical protein